MSAINGANAANVAAPVSLSASMELPSSETEKQADKLYSWFKSNGVNWFDSQKVRLWAKTALSDGKISKDELNELFGKTSFLTRVFNIGFNAGGGADDIEVSADAWSAFFGKGNEEDVVTDSESSDGTVKYSAIETLIRKFEYVSGLGVRQGKDLKSMLETNKIIWVDSMECISSGKQYLKELLIGNINKNTSLSDKEKKELTRKVIDYIDLDKYEMLFANNDGKKIKNFGTPYQFITEDDLNGSEFISSFVNSVRANADEKGMKDYANKVWGLAMVQNLMAMKPVLEKAGVNIYGNFKDVMKARESSKNDLAKLDKQIADEKAKGTGKDEKKLAELILKRDDADRIYKLVSDDKYIGNFFRFASVVAHTGGKDYVDMFEQNGYSIKEEKKVSLKSKTLEYWVNIFKDPKQMAQMLEKKAAETAKKGEEPKPQSPS